VSPLRAATSKTVTLTIITGKSSLLLRFTDDDFLAEEETAATIGVDFKTKSLIVDEKKYKLSIWVSTGEEILSP
jgi:GTPase SAR1 family protein